jgi:hypothetical protein
MTKIQAMAIAVAIADHELRVFGDHCLITQLTSIIREEFDRAQIVVHRSEPAVASTEGDAA